MKKLIVLALASALILSSLMSCSFFGNSYDIGAFPSIGGSNRPGKDGVTPPVDGENQLPNYNWDELDLQIINSIDKLNYYSAIRVLDGETKSKSTSFTTSNYKISSLTTYGEDEEIPSDSTETNNPEMPTDSSENQEDVLIPGVIFYELSPDDVFSFEKVSKFTIELTDENGFLASKLGIGVVEVVVTENCIWGDSLITFRNGDRFYSCLTNGYSYNHNTGGCTWQFSTHKFVEGFYIVKNIVDENYSFNVEMDAEGQVIAFVCRGFKVGGARADKNVKVISSTNISIDGAAYTLSELDAYFKNKKQNENSENLLHEETV